MYIPAEFKELRTEEINRIVREYPLACIVANTAHGLIATHVPLLMKSEQILLGHIAMANDMRTLVIEQQEVLCIFKAEDAYISANYYPSKFVDHQKVPTWNYQAVHIYGTINYFTDHKSKLAAVGMLTKQSEQKANGDAAWKMSDAPRAYIDAQLENLIVFEIKISKILAQSKLSQNREQQDFDGVVKALKQRGKDVMAEEMSKLERN